MAKITDNGSGDLPDSPAPASSGPTPMDTDTTGSKSSSASSMSPSSARTSIPTPPPSVVPPPTLPIHELPAAAAKLSPHFQTDGVKMMKLHCSCSKTHTILLADGNLFLV